MNSSNEAKPNMDVSLNEVITAEESEPVITEPLFPPAPTDTEEDGRVQIVMENLQSLISNPPEAEAEGNGNRFRAALNAMRGLKRKKKKKQPKKIIPVMKQEGFEASRKKLKSAFDSLIAMIESNSDPKEKNK